MVSQSVLLPLLLLASCAYAAKPFRKSAPVRPSDNEQVELVDGRPVLDPLHHDEDMLYNSEIELENVRSHPAMLELRKLKVLMEKARQRKEQMMALEAKLAQMQAQL